MRSIRSSGYCRSCPGLSSSAALGNPCHTSPCAWLVVPASCGPSWGRNSVSNLAMFSRRFVVFLNPRRHLNRALRKTVNRQILIWKYLFISLCYDKHSHARAYNQIQMHTPAHNAHWHKKRACWARPNLHSRDLELSAYIRRVFGAIKNLLVMQPP